MGNPRAIVYYYSIMVDGKFKEHKLYGWRTALAHARNYVQDLFNPNCKVEILNLWTGEIVTIQEAAKRAAKVAEQRQ